MVLNKVDGLVFAYKKSNKRKVISRLVFSFVNREDNQTLRAGKFTASTKGGYARKQSECCMSRRKRKNIKEIECEEYNLRNVKIAWVLWVLDAR